MAALWKNHETASKKNIYIYIRKGYICVKRERKKQLPNTVIKKDKKNKQLSTKGNEKGKTANKKAGGTVSKEGNIYQ